MISFAIKKRCWVVVGTMIAFAGCICLKDEVHELTSGQFPGSYKVVFTNEQQAIQLQQRLLEALHTRHGPDEREDKAGQPLYKRHFWRWRQNDDHLRIDLYIDDLSKQRFERGVGFRLSLDVIDDIAGRIRNGFINPKPGERRYDVFHDPRVMGEWVGWHWGITKKDVIAQIKDPQEFEWELVEDQLAWARLHGMTRREALTRWERWRKAHREWNPYAFSTNKLVVLDGDPGTDDFAGMLLLAKERNRAECFPGVCVATYGNVPVEKAFLNMVLGSWYLAASPVFVRGAAKPYGHGVGMPILFHGEDGMGGTTQALIRRFNLTEDRMRRFTHTQDELIRLVMEADDVTYIATGPLTTMAQILDREPLVASHIKRLYVVGGVLGEPGLPDSDLKLLQKEERNFLADGEAVRRIFASPVDITLFPLNFTRRHAQITQAGIDALAALGRSSVAVSCFRQNLISNVKLSPSVDSAILHDALPALYALHPDRFQTVDRRLSVNHQGHLSDVSGGKVVHVVTDMDQNVFFPAISNAVNRCFEPNRNW